jgi:hypothetical protein
MDGTIKCSALHNDGRKKLANLKTGRKKGEAHMQYRHKFDR